MEGKMMGFVEKISENFESIDTQKINLRKSIFSVFFEWKGFEEQIVSTQNCIRESFSELESKEKELDSVQESLSRSAEELELERHSVKKRLQEAEEKQKEFKLFYDKGIMKLKKERGDFLKEVEFREGNLNEREKNVEGFLKKLEIQKEEISGSMKEVERRRDEIEGKEEKVMEREKKVVLKEKELESMIERQREVELKAKELDLMIEDLVFKEKDVELSRDLNENRWKELDMWEKQLDMKEKQLELMLQKKEEQLEKELLEKNGLMMKKMEDQIRGLEAETKEKEVQLNIETNKEKHSKELLLTDEKHIEAQLEMELLEKSKELDFLKKTFDDRIKVAESKHKHSYEENLDSSRLIKKECHLEKKLQKQQPNEGHHASVKEDAVEESVGRQSQKQLHEENYSCNQLTMMESHLDVHRLKERESQEPQKKQLNDGHHASVKEEANEEPIERQLYKRIHDKNCNDSHLNKKGSHLKKELQKKQLSEKEDTIEELMEKNPSFAGRGTREEVCDLHKFLQEHGKELNSVGDQVIKTIQQSKEPAKLVLIAIEGIYNQVVMNEKGEDKEIAFRSCILLLEQLMKLSVESLSSVEDEALKLATKWKTNMTTRNSLEVLGFLYLLASYKLAFAFSADVLMRFLEVVAQHQQTPELCRHLGLKNKIHVLIGELIKKNQILLAFEYVHEFELVDMFPPVAILKRHVLYSSIEAKKIVKKGNGGKRIHEAQDRALLVEISALKDVIKCVMHHSLHSEYPPDELKARVELLERQRDALKTSTLENQKVDELKARDELLERQRGDSLKASTLENQKIDSHPSDELRARDELLERQRDALKASTLENQKVDSHRSANNTQQDNTMRHQGKKARFRRNKRRRSDLRYKSGSPPPSKCPRHVPSEVYNSEGQRSGKPSSRRHPPDDTLHTDPYAPRQHNQRDSPCHMNNLVSKYLTPGDWESMYPGHPFPYVEDSSSLQPIILVPEQSFYPVRHGYDDRGSLRLVH